MNSLEKHSYSLAKRVNGNMEEFVPISKCTLSEECLTSP